MCATPAHFEEKEPLRKESCTGPYSNIALIRISSYRIITLNRVDEFVPYAHGLESVVDDYRDVVHVVQIGHKRVDLPMSLEGHHLDDSNRGPLRLPYVAHVTLLVHARILPLKLISRGRRSS